MLTSEELGRRVRNAREQAGLSQAQLGEKLQPRRSHAAISDIERGVTRVGATDILQIANLLGSSVTELMGEDVGTPRESVLGRGPTPDELRKSFSRFADDYLKKRQDKADE